MAIIAISVEKVIEKRGKIVIILKGGDYETIFVAKKKKGRIEIRLVDKIDLINVKRQFSLIYIPKKIFTKMRRTAFAIARDYYKRQEYKDFLPLFNNLPA